MTQHTDRLGNSLAVGDMIHGNLWHRKLSHLHRVVEFSKPTPAPRRKVNYAGPIPDETMIRVAGGWVRFNDAYKVCDPSKHLVDSARMDELIHAEVHLNAMQAAGVDNWDDGGMVSELLKENPCHCSVCVAEREEDEE